MDTGYWFDDVTVKKRQLPVPPAEPWGLTVLTDSLLYRIEDVIKVSAYHWSLRSGNTAGGKIISFQIDDPEGTMVQILTERTSDDGWANLSFMLPMDSRRGRYMVYATSDNAQGRATFQVGVRPLFISDVEIQEFCSPGEVIDIVVLIGSAVDFDTTRTIVVQMMSSSEVPLTPHVELINVLRHNITENYLKVAIPSKADLGKYHVQVQMMTGLPKDNGYAEDIFETVITVR
jgi:hypothetical protein